MSDVTTRRLAPLRQSATTLMPGIVVTMLVATTAQFLAEHYGTPAMLLALLLGIAVSFLGEEGKTVPGVAFSARSLLRLGVALLGVRISADLILDLGPHLIGLVVFGVVATIGFGLAVGRLFGRRWRFAFLTAGSVAICGASAAIAISAILPRDARSEQNLIFTVMGVTVLSTMAMILYPILVDAAGLDPRQAGVFLGGTIHDVAQVVGAGYTLSEETGDTATLVKLIRVSMLAPVVLVASLLIRSFAAAPQDGIAPPLLPGFVLGFLVLAALNSAHLIPEQIATLLSECSRWLLLSAIAAVGMKTNLRQVLEVGGSAIGLLVAETVFIAALILAGIRLIG
ncbi:putative integral membrane protein (TIGR00698 family) [Aliiruegeria haliotis]|uniref:Putative integral membrane protein (TIGR00698 family) n=1 Tax=Aliiruegeria haliotis TaxID=1280846 RepID=A0A2T0RVR2_9RHOB|nr:YeiH family protein [Aliiruegeria haliotis]PRY25143.1 putative integral membrane protein (TIGR00698 family) [Aliiruegeria haliotis]